LGDWLLDAELLLNDVRNNGVEYFLRRTYSSEYLLIRHKLADVNAIHKEINRAKSTLV
jgi:hypothetical protein